MEHGENQVLMVRQPIFNQALKIVAYQLRYQYSEQAEDSLFDRDAEGAHLLIHTFTSLCQDGSIGRVPLLLPFPSHLLADEQPLMLPQRGILIEIGADINVTDSVINHLKALRQQGYRLVLDSFSLQPELLPLVKLVNIVKVDFSLMHRRKILPLVNMLTKARITPLAQNVADFDTLNFCKAAGFQLFQGKFISRPSKIFGKDIPGNSAALLQLIARLQGSEISPAEIEELIVMDPKLSFKILKVVNSAAYRLSSPINSMQQAIVMMGHDQLRKWATLITLTGNQEKPEVLCRNLLSRARMCELLSESTGIGLDDSAFMVGMISQLDLLLEVDMSTLLEQIPLDQSIKLAISEQHGELGRILKSVIAFEDGNWEGVETSELGKAFFDVAYRHSQVWADQALEALGAAS